MVKIKCLTVGPLEANAYILYHTAAKEAVVIDPGDEEKKILRELDKSGCTLNYMLLTHGHADHIGAVPYLKQQTKATVAMHAADADMLTSSKRSLWRMFYGERPFGLMQSDLMLKEGDILPLGDEEIHVMHTPGHSPGSICFMCGDYLFTGDTLFKSGVGRVDLPGGDGTLLQRSLKRINQLERNCIICAGHGNETTMQEERRLNPFLMAIYDDSFVL